MLQDPLFGIKHRAIVPRPEATSWTDLLTAVESVETKEPARLKIDPGPIPPPVAKTVVQGALVEQSNQPLDQSQEVKVTATLVNRPVLAQLQPPMAMPMAMEETSPSKLLTGAQGFPCPVAGCPTIALTQDYLNFHQARVHNTAHATAAWTEQHHKCPYCEHSLPLDEYLDHVNKQH